eukprot:4023229-Amphidinium_carterae.3
MAAALAPAALNACAKHSRVGCPKFTWSLSNSSFSPVFKGAGPGGAAVSCSGSSLSTGPGGSLSIDSSSSMGPASSSRSSVGKADSMLSDPNSVLRTSLSRLPSSWRLPPGSLATVPAAHTRTRCEVKRVLDELRLSAWASSDRWAQATTAKRCHTCGQAPSPTLSVRLLLQERLVRSGSWDGNLSLHTQGHSSA